MFFSTGKGGWTLYLSASFLTPNNKNEQTLPKVLLSWISGKTEFSNHPQNNSRKHADLEN
jgi:hypothetical protein